MAAAKTDAGEALALNALLAGGSTVGLFTSATGETSGGVEVVGGSYGRQNTGFGSTGTSTSRSNPAEILFPAATADWGLITHFAIFNSVGVMIYYGALPVAKAVTMGDVFRFGPGELSVGED